jgi:uncharacterized spore protein YtfJ
MTNDTDSDSSGWEIVEAVWSNIEGLQNSATVDRVYGDPVEAEGRTLLPVARIAYGYGFGSGFGTGAPDDGESAGGGGGGGGTVRPIGVVDVSEDGTRFLRFSDRKRLSLAAGVGLALGYLLGRR